MAKKQHRIAFVGAAGTGKTSLINLVNTLAALPVIQTGSRELAQRMGFETPYSVDAVGRRGEFQRRLLEEKVAEERQRECFITDRSVADVLAYYAMHDPKGVGEEHIELARDAFARYTHVYLLPMRYHFQPGNDPARIRNNPAYHEIFEKLCFAWVYDWSTRLNALEVQVGTLNMIGLSERAEYVRLHAGL